MTATTKEATMSATTFDMMAANDNRGLEIVGHINTIRADCHGMSRRAGMGNGIWSPGASRHFNEQAAAVCKRYRLTNSLWHAFCRMAGDGQ
jgi:hypothetical protein